MKRIAEFMLQQIFSPYRLHVRNDLHLARKTWHMFMGVAMASIYYAGMSTHIAVLLLTLSLAIGIVIEFSRLNVPSFNEKVVRFCGPIMRTCEVNRVSGIPFYILATLLSIGIFPKPIAILSILYLAFGDPVASIFGILYGKYSMRFSNGKSLIGTLAGIVTCCLVGFIFLQTLSLPANAYLSLVLLGGIAGGVAELMPFDMDDNLSIPIVSGFVLWLGFIIFGV